MLDSEHKEIEVQKASYKRNLQEKIRSFEEVLLQKDIEHEKKEKELRE